MFAMTVALYFAYGVVQGGGRREVVGMSAGLAAAALVRPEALILYPTLVLGLVLLRREQPWRERWVRLGLAALVPIVAFAPWAIYNQGRFERPVPISTGAGQTLAVGNCDLTYEGAFLGFYNIGCLREPQIDPPTDTDPSERDASYQRIARDYIGDNVGDLPRVVAARVGRLWHVYQIDQGLRLDGYIEGRSGGPPGSSLVFVRAALWSYYVLVVLAIAGGVRGLPPPDPALAAGRAGAAGHVHGGHHLRGHPLPRRRRDRHRRPGRGRDRPASSRPSAPVRRTRRPWWACKADRDGHIRHRRRRPHPGRHGPPAPAGPRGRPRRLPGGRGPGPVGGARRVRRPGLLGVPRAPRLVAARPPRPRGGTERRPRRGRGRGGPGPRAGLRGPRRRLLRPGRRGRARPRAVRGGDRRRGDRARRPVGGVPGRVCTA